MIVAPNCTSSFICHLPPMITTIDGCAVNQFNTTPGYEWKLKNGVIDTNFYLMYYKQIKLNFKLLICKPSVYFIIWFCEWI